MSAKRSHPWKSAFGAPQQRLRQALLRLRLHLHVASAPLELRKCLMPLSNEKSFASIPKADSPLLGASMLLAALLVGPFIGVSCIAPALHISPALAALVMISFMFSGVTLWLLLRLQHRVDALCRCLETRQRDSVAS